MEGNTSLFARIEEEKKRLTTYRSITTIRGTKNEAKKGAIIGLNSLSIEYSTR